MAKENGGNDVISEETINLAKSVMAKENIALGRLQASWRRAGGGVAASRQWLAGGGNVSNHENR
jgi:hypothetical protein